MIVLRVRNVHEALERCMSIMSDGRLRFLEEMTLTRDENRRNGPVIEAPWPVATVYERPWERVLTQPWRDANPFLHFYESLWMLAGRRDVAPLARYARRMESFSDDGQTLNAAYGHRWRCMTARGQEMEPDYSRDQLLAVCSILREDPKSRQAVLQIWDHERDLGSQTKDHACNVAATFQITSVAGFAPSLCMTVFCRSNDVIWGAYGANAVHFSMLHEYVWLRLRDVQVDGRALQIGPMTQISVNWHAYESVLRPMLERRASMASDRHVPDPYWNGEDVGSPGTVFAWRPMCGGVMDDTWDLDVRRFVTNDGRLPGNVHYRDSFFNKVAWPIVQAHDIYKDYVQNRDASLWGDVYEALSKCEAGDWRVACEQWMRRRQERQRASGEP